MIAEAAYFRVKRRGFCGTDAERHHDWVEAEAEIDLVIGLVGGTARSR
jgi:hypothetical protein